MFNTYLYKVSTREKQPKFTRYWPTCPFAKNHVRDKEQNYFRKRGILLHKLIDRIVIIGSDRIGQLIGSC